jgi:hypothetical protein
MQFEEYRDRLRLEERAGRSIDNRRLPAQDGVARHTWPLWPLSVLYAVFFACVAMLYVPCRWFAEVKARGGPRWVRYV